MIPQEHAAYTENSSEERTYSLKPKSGTHYDTHSLQVIPHETTYLGTGRYSTEFERHSRYVDENIDTPRLSRTIMHFVTFRH